MPRKETNWGLPFGFLLLIALLAALAGCAPALHQTGPSPCDDTQLVDLRARPVDDLSTREYERLQQLEKACSDYQAMGQLDEARRGRNRLGIVGLLLILAIMPFALADA